MPGNRARSQPGVALVAAVSHLTCCAIGLLSSSSPTFRVLAGAVSKLRAHRRDRLGVEEPLREDVPLVDDGPNFVLTATAAFARFAMKVRAPHFARRRRTHTLRHPHTPSSVIKWSCLTAAGGAPRMGQPGNWACGHARQPCYPPGGSWA